MATINSASYTLTVPRPSASARDLTEVILVFSSIVVVLWLPTGAQLIFGPIALLAPLIQVLWTRPSLNELGLGWRRFVSSLWIFPAAVTLAIAGIATARNLGTLRTLYQADFGHVGGYVLWTLYQQFLLQDYFMPRLSRILTSHAAIALAAVLFAAAHLPNLPLALATLAWGGISCALFRRYRSVYILGLTQGLLGLCFAVCVPDAMHHHMRVGLGFFHYQLGR